MGSAAGQPYSHNVVRVADPRYQAPTLHTPLPSHNADRGNGHGRIR